MDKAVKPKNGAKVWDPHKLIAGAYLAPDMMQATIEWEEGVNIAESSNISELDGLLAWVRGHVTGIYGWPNDGKGTFYDFTALMKALFDGWKFGIMRQEDVMSYKPPEDNPRISANHIYNNLVWMKSGKTPYKHYALKYNIPQLSLKEYQDELEWVREHFYIINPKDRSLPHILDVFAALVDVKGISAACFDPWKSVKLLGDPYEALNLALMDIKDFSIQKHVCTGIVAHPCKQRDVKDKKGAFKVVDQFMVSGGPPWDNNLDSQYSIYRPFRHSDPKDPNVHFINLKQRMAELSLADRGQYDFIRFERSTKRYFFNGICPIDGSRQQEKFFGSVLANKTPDTQMTINQQYKDDETPF